MIVGVPGESYPGERRVALVPAIIPNLTKAEIHRETLLMRDGEIVNARVREFLGLPALAAAEHKGA